MKLSKILKNVEYRVINKETLNAENKEPLNADDINIIGLTLDSRRVKPGYVFFAVKGFETDGHKYIQKAIANGAVAVVLSDANSLTSPSFDADISKEKTAFILVDDMRKSMSEIADNFYDKPGDKIVVYGVTGTNGKTTTTNVIRDILENGMASPINCGYIGTSGIKYGEVEIAPEMTTPDVITLKKYLYDMVNAGMRAVSMEVSSHGLALGRVDGISFDVAAFTNLTHDHLDFHKTMEEYFAAKQLLFKGLSPKAISILNADDESTIEKLKEVSGGEVFTYGMKDSDYMIRDLVLKADGSSFTLEISSRAMDAHRSRTDSLVMNSDGAFGKSIYQIETNLLAEYNVYNLVAAIACLHQRGFKIEDFTGWLDNITQVDGRMESVPNDLGINVIVDYAHTVDAMEKVYDFVESVCESQEDLNRKRPKIISVFGSAGKRDKTKRPYMGITAYNHSDYIILTEDDPRDEDPAQIAYEIKGELDDGNISIIIDRVVAIRTALEMAKKGDFVLVLGKGEDRFMAREFERAPWDGDNIIAKRILNELSSTRKSDNLN